jgi:hypothetical protein
MSVISLERMSATHGSKLGNWLLGRVREWRLIQPTVQNRPRTGALDEILELSASRAYDAALEITGAYKLTGNFSVDLEIALKDLGAIGKVTFEIEPKSRLSDCRRVAFRPSEQVDAREFAAVIVAIRSRLGADSAQAWWTRPFGFGASRNKEKTVDPRRNDSAAPKTPSELPRRPDRSVLNETFPLFYIGRNMAGLWVALAADGRQGGLFVLKHSAVRFAREASEPEGCALMFVVEPLELDAGDGARRHSAAATIVAEGQRLSEIVSRALSAGRRNREAVEQELFGGRYKLSSKNDDDLPAASA